MDIFITNPEIIQTTGDMKIGGKVVLPDRLEDGSVSYEDYIFNLVRNRVYSLVVEEVSQHVKDGCTQKEAIEDCLELVYNMLSMEERKYPTDEDGITDEILNSTEFKNWSTEIMYRFFNTHKGKVDEKTPVKLTEFPYGNTELIEQMKEEDSLHLFLDGLNSI